MGKRKITHPIIKKILIEIECHAKGCNEYDREMDVRCIGCSQASQAIINDYKNHKKVKAIDITYWDGRGFLNSNLISYARRKKTDHRILALYDLNNKFIKYINIGMIEKIEETEVMVDGGDDRV